MSHFNDELRREATNHRIEHFNHRRCWSKDSLLAQTVSSPAILTRTIVACNSSTFKRMDFVPMVLPCRSQPTSLDLNLVQPQSHLHRTSFFPLLNHVVSAFYISTHPSHNPCPYLTLSRPAAMTQRDTPNCAFFSAKLNQWHLCTPATHFPSR